MEIWKRNNNKRTSRQVVVVAHNTWIFQSLWFKDSPTKEYDERLIDKTQKRRRLWDDPHDWNIWEKLLFPSWIILISPPSSSPSSIKETNPNPSLTKREEKSQNIVSVRDPP